MHLTLKSRNVKTGPIPVTTSARETCPSACPLKGNGCYAESGPLALHWRKVTTATTAATLAAIAALPKGTLWRHNQAGDLAGTGDTIDVAALAALVSANNGKRGFTYTHKPTDSPNNRDAIAHANANGFTVNLSADTLTEADELASLGIGPVVVVVTRDAPERLATPQGRRVVVCPAQTRDDVTCQSCQLCARATRDVIVGFRAHGAGARKAEAVTV
jgi:hypothetical protein